MYHSIALVSNIAAAAILVLAAIIDIRTGRIPDRLVLAGAAVGLVLAPLNAQRGLSSGLLGGIAAGLIMLLLKRITRE